MPAQTYPAPTPITVVDLFAGCGGFTQGFHEFRPAGVESDGPVFQSITAVEHDKAAAATYAANFGSLRPDSHLHSIRVHVGDIQEWQPTEEDLHAEVIVGGPPCQGFSGLNRDKVGAERNTLWREYIRVVGVIKPKVFVIENVDRFLKSDEFQDLLREVGPGGSLSDYRLLDPPGADPADSQARRAARYLLTAADYGAVQARRRAIVIGVREDVDADRLRYPELSHTARTRPAGHGGQSGLFELEGEPESWLPVAGVFAESAALALGGTELPENREWFPEIDEKVPGVFTTGDLHIRRTPEPLSRARYRAIPPGGNRTDLRGKWYTVTETGDVVLFDHPEPAGVRTPVGYLSTDSWDRHTKGTGDVMGRLRIDAPSVTIRTEFYKPEKGRYLHPVEDRPITHYEAARIQGFPVGFRWCGTKIQIARQIGNAVPIPLGRAIASSIYAALRG